MKKFFNIFTLNFIFILSIQASLLEDLPEIRYETFKLDNGLTVIVHEDKKVPMVAVNVWYHVGSKNEKVGKTGFAHLFEHLMFNGTENYNSEYFEPFEKIGSTDQNGTTNSDRTNYFQNVPTNALDLALWMESDRMGHLLGVVDQEKLDEQRGVVQNEKRQGENQPYGKAFTRISEAAFPICSFLRAFAFFKESFLIFLMALFILSTSKVLIFFFSSSYANRLYNIPESK